MTDAGVHFGKVPYAVVASGAIASMSRAELAVYVVLAGHAGNAAFEAAPAVATIARLAGVSGRTVRRVTARLAARGLLAVEPGGGPGKPGGGRGKANVYRLETRTPGRPPLDQKPGHPDVRLSAEKPGHPERKPGHPATETRTSRRPPKREKRRKDQIVPAACAAAAGAASPPEPPAGGDGEPPAPHPDVVAALARHGVGEPTRSRLAAAGLTVGRIDAAAAAVNGGGPGLLVVRLREEIEMTEKQRRDLQAARDLRDRQAAERSAKASDAKATLAASEAFKSKVAAMAPADRDALKARAIAEMPEADRSRYAAADPLTNRVLRAWMWQVDGNGNGDAKPYWE